jgi:hypothetical protein
VHLGCISEIAQDWSLAIASPLCVVGTQTPFQDCAGETLSRTLPLAPFGRRRSKSISDSDLNGWGMFYHNGGNCALSRGSGDSSICMQRHTFVSKSFLREASYGHCRIGCRV